MNMEELRRSFSNLSFDNIGDWPAIVKSLVAVLVAILVIGAGFYFLTRDTITELEEAERSQEALQVEFEKKWGEAANLEAYKAQLEEMKKSFAILKRQLPDKSQVPDLLVEITQAGLGNGLEFDLFQPKREKPAESYAELPISIVLRGAYHDMAQFVSDVAGFARIVTLHDVTVITETDSQLRMSATAKTYRYIEEDEQ